MAEGGSSSSRLLDYEKLDELGSGGFGNVFKARNKLDKQFYAIKEICLDPENELENKKIKREVRLLSKLNHVNVVRYYSAWYEESRTVRNLSNSSAAENQESSSIKYFPLTETLLPKLVTKPDNSSRDHLGVEENLDNVKTDIECETDQDTSCSEAGDDVEFLGSESITDIEDTEDDESEDTEEDEPEHTKEDEPEHTKNSTDTSDGNSVVFEDEIKDTENPSSNLEPNSDQRFLQRQDPNTQPPTRESVVTMLYIQMEFCESTLKNSIDNGLHKDMDRVWELFRQILSGLAYIHNMDIIHRDLKPLNIFLDSKDKVKIGDFGLATEVRQKQAAAQSSSQPSSLDLDALFSATSQGSSQGDLTAHVGSFYYISPELIKGVDGYDKKVDMYSLGIIFFEMCYECFQTDMDRNITLINLRQPSINFPSGFDKIKLAQQETIIKNLLDHDPTIRCSAQSLLGSKWLPQSKQQETELQTLFQNRGSASHEVLLNTLFNQKANRFQDIIYDRHIYPADSISPKLFVFQEIETTLTRIFMSHGAVHISLPLLMPCISSSEDNDRAVKLSDRNGIIVTLPRDLRVSMARYVRKNLIYRLKCFSFEKIFMGMTSKQYPEFSLHPTTETQCTFDIIAPASSSCIPDAEVLSVVQEIIDSYSCLKNARYILRVNHLFLLRALLLHYGLPDFALHKVLSSISVNGIDETTIKLMESFVKVTPDMVSMLQSEGSINEIKKKITKCISLPAESTIFDTKVNQLARKALEDIENVLTYAKTLGLKLEVVVSVGLVYNPDLYCGLIYQVKRIFKKKKRPPVVIADGGRYDNSACISLDWVEQVCCVGITIYFDKLVHWISHAQKVAPYDVIICTVGKRSLTLIKQSLEIARDLWAAKLRAKLFYENIEHKQDFKQLKNDWLKQGVPYIVSIENHSPPKKQKGHPDVKAGMGKDEEKSAQPQVLVYFLENKKKVVKELVPIQDLLIFLRSLISAKISS